MLIEDPSDEVLAALRVENLPTWMRFVPEPAAGLTPAAESGETDLRVAELTGTSMSGQPLSLAGPWVLTHGRSGALPKHVIDAEFGPSS